MKSVNEGCLYFTTDVIWARSFIWKRNIAKQQRQDSYQNAVRTMMLIYRNVRNVTGNGNSKKAAVATNYRRN